MAVFRDSWGDDSDEGTIELLELCRVLDLRRRLEEEGDDVSVE